MKIYAHRCERPNVGDEINHWFWREIIGDALDDAANRDLLLGIGTVLNEKLPIANHYHILGSGFGYAEQGFSLAANMQVHFVRGPLTAHVLGISPARVITDPGCLIAELRPQSVLKRHAVSFMPHISMDSRDYQCLIADMGMNYISPSHPQDQIFRNIAESERLLTSAMHGAIFADAYRVPWIPLQTSHQILSFKWQDWMQSIELDYQPVKLPAIWSFKSKHIMQRIKVKIKKNRFTDTLKVCVNDHPGLLSDINLIENKKTALKKAIAKFCNEELACDMLMR